MEKHSILLSTIIAGSVLCACQSDPEKFEDWSWMSLWSSVYNSHDLSLDVCIRENYDKKFSFKITAVCR